VLGRVFNLPNRRPNGHTNQYANSYDGNRDMQGTLNGEHGCVRRFPKQLYELIFQSVKRRDMEIKININCVINPA